MSSEASIGMSPMALGVVETIAKYISMYGGAALLVDYGEFGTQSDTLRGYQRHKHVSVLSSIWEVDITTDVDFFALSQIVKLFNTNHAEAEAGLGWV